MGAQTPAFIKSFASRTDTTKPLLHANERGSARLQRPIVRGTHPPCLVSGAARVRLRPALLQCSERKVEPLHHPATMHGRLPAAVLAAAVLLLCWAAATAHAHGHADVLPDGRTVRHKHSFTVKVVNETTAELARKHRHAGGGYEHHKHGARWPPYCSCAHPQPLPVYSSAHAEAEAADDNEDAATQGYARRHQHAEDQDWLTDPWHSEQHEQYLASSSLDKDDYCAACNSLRRVGRGGECGAALGICKKGLCCDQTGHCTDSAVGCDGTCQCDYSGPGSKCRGSLPFALPLTLPTAAPGGPCGIYAATCPVGQCCSQFGFCVADGSIYCGMPSCIPGASLGSATCIDSAWARGARAAGRLAAAPPIATTSPNYKYERGAVKRFDWVVTWRNLTLDGFQRPVIVVNGEPFPNIFVNVADRVIVKVTNRLQDPLSIHWHGIRQIQTNIMDGVDPVTQRGVQPGESYIYNFIADAQGTYWWHSHYKTQYVDGLWGGLIIEDPTARTVASEAVVAINEWYHELATVLQDFYLSPASQGNEPVPYDALLNGNGQGYCINNDLNNTCSYAHIKGTASSCDNPQTMIRIINSGAFAVFNVSVDNHRLIIVGEDAVPIEPTEVGSLQINNGQRYTVMVCQQTATPSTQPVWIRATMIDDNFAVPSAYNTTLGVLYFLDADKQAVPTTQPVFEPPALSPDQVGPGIVNPYLLRTLGGVAPPGPATTTLEYTIFFFNEPDPNNPNDTQYAHFNNISLDMVPEQPSLLERLTNNPGNVPPPRNPPLPRGGRGWHTVPIQLGAVVDMVINNQDTGEHPLHLHGQWFFVMAAGLPNAGDYDPRANNTILGGRLARDTVTVNLKSHLVLRFISVNPGAWIFHCHIDWHLVAGLGLIYKEAFPPPYYPAHPGYGGALDDGGYAGGSHGARKYHKPRKTPKTHGKRPSEGE